MKPLSRLVIAGTHSGVGKTTVATALMAAFRQRGLAVQGFKVGPDFIDPTFHSAATGRPGRNLDGWMLPRETNLALFQQAARDADVAVIEGVMGLFDGQSAVSMSGSTAEMARWLDAPVILVVDASAMAGSAAALVKGFETFDPELRVSGVVFSGVAGAGHFAYLRDALAAHCRAIPLGYLPRDPAIELPERHLGLKLAEEVISEDRLRALAAWIEKHLDLDQLLALGRVASFAPRAGGPPMSHPAPARRPRIGVARDRAFCFYYQDNLDILASLGAELVEFSPIADAHLPAGLGGLYLGGGYPELHAAALSANESMRDGIAGFAKSGSPVYAECGGFMYLTEGIVDQAGCLHPMAGVFPTRARMQARLAALGYTEIEGVDSSSWLQPGERARGHEFRYSSIDEMPPHVERTYRVSPKGDEKREGFRQGATVASYIHLHFLSCPQFAARFVSACANTKLL
ncbi:cobyrinate a,c-diamide synthase [uncultured Paludibaculum sp.]|uniref:cobyrinate a,c-diamide synthase n=1 Tax=uncultured Paludibaculum sp. TaxID=1765020 RepID=UPI002AABA1FF|nr:cobyrinate a,c-diamide synthase [uncultured Paludibaculum sp.]